MKKIFTFILLAISTLAMAQAFPGEPGRVVAAAGDIQKTISPATIEASDYEVSGTRYNVQNATINGAEYRLLVNAFDEEGNPCLEFAQANHHIATQTTFGNIKSVTITWKSNTAMYDEIAIYGKNTPYGTSASENTNSGTLAATLTYTGATTSTYTMKSNAKYQYIVIKAATGTPRVDAITITWQPITAYTLSVDPSFDTNKASISFSNTTVESGTTVDITFKGKEDEDEGLLYELHSYTINGTTTNLAESDYTSSTYTVKYTVTSNTVVSAEYELDPGRRPNTISIDGPGVDKLNKTITITSGSSVNLTITTKSPTNISTKIASTATATQELNGQTLKLTAFNQGTTTITVSTVQSNAYAKTTLTYNIKVVPREVMLITEYNGKFYAVANSLSNGKLAAQEVQLNNGVAYIPADATYNQNKLTWKVCTKADESFTIQNSSNNYLGYSSVIPETMTLTSKVYDWYKYDDEGQSRFYINGNEIVYYSTQNWFSAYAYNRCDDNAAYAHGAYEIDQFYTAETVKLRENLTSNAFSTTCQSYSFIAAEGVELYEIDNIENNHIYFCCLDAGEITTAGQPYIIKSNSATAMAYKIGDEGAEAGTHNGLYGVYGNTTWNTLWTTQPSLFYNSNVMVFKKDGSIAHVEYDTTRGGGGGIAGHSACILLSEVNHGASTCSPADSGAAPRRVSLAVEEPQVPTAVENTLNASSINWNEPVYNIMGQRVARGTTGVLIQNGQKFIAE